MQPPRLVDHTHDGDAILKDAKDAADERKAQATKARWWKFWAKPRHPGDVVDGG